MAVAMSGTPSAARWWLTLVIALLWRLPPAGAEGPPTETGVSQPRVVGMVSQFEQELGAGFEGGAEAARKSPGGGVLERDQNAAVFSPETVAAERRDVFSHLSFDMAVRYNNRVWGRRAPFSWNPAGDKFVVMECHTGRASNRLRCIQNHILVAGLLNRTLILDTSRLEPSQHHYNWSLLFDIRHVRRCFGRFAVVSTDEYRAGHHGRRLQLDALLCWRKHCGMPWDWWKEAVSPPDTFRSLSPRDPVHFEFYFLGQYAHMRAIAVGDLVSRDASIPGGNASFEDVPFLRKSHCRNHATILPHPRIVALALKFVTEAFRGQPFLAVHYRGGDLWKKCRTVPAACVTLEHAAVCIHKEALRSSLSLVLICSDRRAAELNHLKALLMKEFQAPLEVVFNPGLPEAESDLIGISGEGEAAYQKIVMAQGLVFLGTATSSFSIDVARMRHGFQTRHSQDSYLCLN